MMADKRARVWVWDQALSSTGQSGLEPTRQSMTPAISCPEHRQAPSIIKVPAIILSVSVFLHASRDTRLFRYVSALFAAIIPISAIFTWSIKL
jgi:hypothetical protein